MQKNRQRKKRRERIRPKKRKLHELLYTEFVIFGTIRLASVVLNGLRISVKAVLISQICS